MGGERQEIQLVIIEFEPLNSRSRAILCFNTYILDWILDLGEDFPFSLC